MVALIPPVLEGFIESQGFSVSDSALGSGFGTFFGHARLQTTLPQTNVTNMEPTQGPANGDLIIIYPKHILST